MKKTVVGWLKCQFPHAKSAARVRSGAITFHRLYTGRELRQMKENAAENCKRHRIKSAYAAFGIHVGAAQLFCCVVQLTGLIHCALSGHREAYQGGRCRSSGRSGGGPLKGIGMRLDRCDGRLTKQTSVCPENACPSFGCRFSVRSISAERALSASDRNCRADLV